MARRCESATPRDREPLRRGAAHDPGEEALRAGQDGDRARRATAATVKKALVGIRDRYAIEVEGGPDLSAKGNVVQHEYEIERDGHKVAEISKRWLRVRDAYGIEVAPDEDDALILAITVCIEQLGHD